MAGAKLRRIILPDALNPSSRKPGPAERSSKAFRELSDALRSKQLISEWSLANSSSATAELQLREALTRTLSDHCYFGYIRPGLKLPQGHPLDTPKLRYEVSTDSGSRDFIRANGTNWLAASGAPRSGNWSVIPKASSRLLAFDLDVRKHRILADGSKLPTTAEERYLEARRSIAQLELLLGMDLRQTYAQRSPSGGVHIFLLLPEGVDPTELPSSKISNGMRELAQIPRDRWKTELRGDIRSGASNGFILMVGSQIDDPEGYYSPLVADPRWSDFKDYRSGRKLRLLELPDAAVERLREARRLDRASQTERDRKPKALSSEVTTGKPQPLRHTELKASSYSRILQRLRAEPLNSYHEARAQIYRALSCCSSPESIASVCREAGYGRDSYRDRELTDAELLADMASMEQRGLRSMRCGSHCSSIGSDSTVDPERQNRLEELVAEILAASADQTALDELSSDRARSSALLRARSMLELEAQRVADYGIYGRRKPRGFSYRTLTQEILGAQVYGKLLRHGQVKIAGFRLRALELALGYFGPLFSAGSSTAIASSKELTSLFGWTESQLREALRHLRAVGAISLTHRQISGRASGYGPGESRFFDPILSRKLRAAWGASRVEDASGERAFLGGYFDYSRGRVLRPDGTSYTDGYLREVGGGFAGLLEELDIRLPKAAAVGRSVVSRYLSKSLDHYLELSLRSRADELQEALDELQELGMAVDPDPRVVFDSVDDLWTSSEPSRKDRSAGRSRSIRGPRIVAGQLGDRSPPDDPGDHRNSPRIAKRKRKTIDAT